MDAARTRVGLLVAVALLLGACGSAATPSAPTPLPQPSNTPTAVVPGPAKVRLLVWDQFERDTERALIDRLNGEFEANHAGVKVIPVVRSFEELKRIVPPALSDPNGPDVVQINQGADMRAAVQAGLLLDLTPYLQKYEWDRRFSASVLARNSFSADGSLFGTGNLYGVSPTAEVVGVYLNRAKFEQLGLAVPRTRAEFEALLAAEQLAGETPLVFGNRDVWPGMHVFGALEHVLLPDRTWLDNFVYSREPVSFNTPENVQAAGELQGWVRAGYLGEGFAEIGYDDAWRRFAAGEGLMMLAGSWLSAEVVRSGGERFGFFLLPAQEADDRVLAIGGVGLPFSIRRGTVHADLAAEYLDWMVSAHAGEVWLGTACCRRCRCTGPRSPTAPW